VINYTMSVKTPNLVSFKPFPNPVNENPSHFKLEMMRSTGLSNSICFFCISFMSKGKKVKLAFHAMVANYCGNLVMSSIILDAATCFAI